MQRLPIENSTTARAGDKVMVLDYTGLTSGHHVQNIVNGIVVSDQHSFHMIAYTATSNILFGQTYPTAKLGDWSPSLGFAGHMRSMVFVRKVTSRQNTAGRALYFFPRLRSKANEACIIYYDDIVLYADSNSEADLQAPISAEHITFIP